ncbi:hypothetical protein ADUPG1_008207 [Aduncisulcus paluster]|uniref:Protein kinase domain-containing protein n=1 Tax=Aduncisulcus paluster TaxID=2918883 RepID=A0ABQ5KTL0_9EUKA|nr:hypothetical protein ADUPG1_008207 [Aduncisulcus paluster]
MKQAISMQEVDSISGSTRSSQSSSHGHKRKKHDSNTLYSSSNMEPLCILGRGGFGEVILVNIVGMTAPCILKKMLRIGDSKVVSDCRKEFKHQCKLFMNPMCSNRIPRPLYILDLLDANYQGIYGFCMEFCVGGSVKAFAQSWCSRKRKPKKSLIDDEFSDDFFFNSESDSDTAPLNDHHDDPLSLDPLRVCSLCVGMIECLDDVFTAKPTLVHRDIKPENFLVRTDPKDQECVVVLADLGLAMIQQSVLKSGSTVTIADMESLKKDHLEIDGKQKHHSFCGTVSYSSYESLKYGEQSQKSDAHSLGMSILALFLCSPPFVNHPCLLPIRKTMDIVQMVANLLKQKRFSPLSRTPLFNSLNTIEDGKFKPVHDCLNEVFKGLTLLDVDKRMDVHTAREKVQSIKHLLPKIGEGWKCPSIDDIVSSQLAKYDGDPGTIEVSTFSSSSSSLFDAMRMERVLREERVRNQLILPPFSKGELELLIKQLSMATSVSAVTSLFDENIPRLNATFQAHSTPSDVKQNELLFVLCFDFLSAFITHEYINLYPNMTLNLKYIKEFVDSFWDLMLNIESILRSPDKINSITYILLNMTLTILSKYSAAIESEYPQILTMLKDLLQLVSTQKIRFEITFSESILKICQNIAAMKGDSPKDSLLSLLLPYFPLLLKYSSKQSFFMLIDIIAHITLDADNSCPHRERSSQLWTLFRPILDVIKDSSESMGQKFDNDSLLKCLSFFSNLCCVSDHVSEIYESLKDLFDVWFDTFKEAGKYHSNILPWSKLIAILSTYPSLTPHLSPKYDKHMEFCRNNGGWSEYLTYLNHCYPCFRKWADIIHELEHSDEKNTVELYHKHHKEILDIFDAATTAADIELHKLEILLGSKCLQLFVSHSISGTTIFLPISDLNLLISTFFEHFIRFESEKSFGIDLSEIFCQICSDYLSQDLTVEKNDFFAQILPTFKLILKKMSSKKVLRDHPICGTIFSTLKFESEKSFGIDLSEIFCQICSDYLSQDLTVEKNDFFAQILPTFKLILKKMSSKKVLRDHPICGTIFSTLKSISTTASVETKISIIVSVIKPFIMDLMPIMGQSEYRGHWISLLADISWSEKDMLPLEPVSLEAWHLIDHVLVISRERVKLTKGLGGQYDYTIKYFSNLCCNSSHAVDVYERENIQPFLEEWFGICTKQIENNPSESNLGILFWAELVSMLSTIPALVSKVSPKFDYQMAWYKSYSGSPDSFYRYLRCTDHSMRKWFILYSTILQCYPPKLTKLYEKYRDKILEIFEKNETPEQIESNSKLIIIVFDCLNVFVKHNVPKLGAAALPIPSLNDIVGTFTDYMLTCVEVLKDLVYEPFFQFCWKYVILAKESEYILSKVSTVISEILINGCKKRVFDRFHLIMVSLLKNIARYSTNGTKSSIIQLIIPHFKAWLRKYRFCQFISQWFVILGTLTWSSDGNFPHIYNCIESWPLFPSVLDFVQKYCVGESILANNNIYTIQFFTNLCSDRSKHAFEVYFCTRDLLDGWYEAIKKTKHEEGIKFWSQLISILSTVPSLVPLLSPKYDTHMEWCKDNGASNEDISTYIKNFNSYRVSRMRLLVKNIQKTTDTKGLTSLYLDNREMILSIFKNYSSDVQIQVHQNEIMLCFEALKLFVKVRPIQRTEVCLPIPQFNDLIDTFIDYLSTATRVLKGSVDENYCTICANYTVVIKENKEAILPKIVSTFKLFFERGAKRSLGRSIPLYSLITLKNIALVVSYPSRASILSLISPYFKDWIRLYPGNSYIQQWQAMLLSITSTEDGIGKTESESLCSSAWSLFHPLVDLVREICAGEMIIEDDHDDLVKIMANLCSIPSHIPEIFEALEDLLEEWIVVIKSQEYRWGMYAWAYLVSLFSTDHSIVSQISPKYDKYMAWCNTFGEIPRYYIRYVSNVSSNHTKWNKLLTDVTECGDSESSSKLYHEHRDSILSTLQTFQSSSEIRNNSLEIEINCIALQELMTHSASESKQSVYLLFEDLHDIITVFLPHILRFEKEIEGLVSNSYWSICVSYSHVLYCVKPHYDLIPLKDAFLPLISSNLDHFLERGTISQLPRIVSLFIVVVIENISNTPSSSTKASLMSIIKPYIKDWLESYHSETIYSRWLMVFGYSLWSCEENSPNRALCQDSWYMFEHILSIVKEIGVAGGAESMKCYGLLCLANFCCIPEYAEIVFTNIQDLIDGWFDSLQHEKRGSGIPLWSKLISMLSTVPSIVPHISPKYDSSMEWCKENGNLETLSLEPEYYKWIKGTGSESISSVFESDYARYQENCKQMIL